MEPSQIVYSSLVISIYVILAFMLGSLPFSIWIGRATTGRDIREFGDRNPGATNVLRAGSRAGFLLAMIVDISKGALVVGLAYQVWDIQDWRIVPITLAPVAGHAFSPFLGGQGGKALATAFGVWIGLSNFALSLPALGFLILWRLLIRPPGWALLLALACLGILIAVWPQNPLLLIILAAQSSILLYKERADLRQRPSLKRQKASGQCPD